MKQFIETQEVEAQMNHDEAFLRSVREKIAADLVPKKSVARRLNVSRPDFSRLIRGEKAMSADQRQRLADILDLQCSV